MHFLFIGSPLRDATPTMEWLCAVRLHPHALWITLRQKDQRAHPLLPPPSFGAFFPASQTFPEGHTLDNSHILTSFYLEGHQTKALLHNWNLCSEFYPKKKYFLENKQVSDLKQKLIHVCRQEDSLFLKTFHGILASHSSRTFSRKRCP